MADLIGMLRQSCTEDTKRITEEIKHLTSKAKNMTLSGLSTSLGAEALSIIRETLSGEINNAINDLTEKIDDELEKNTAITKLIKSTTSLFDITAITTSLEVINSIIDSIEVIKLASKKNIIFCRALEMVEKNSYKFAYILDNSLEDDCDELISGIITEDSESLSDIKAIYGESYSRNGLISILRSIVHILSELNPKEVDFSGIKEKFIKSRKESYKIQSENAYEFKKTSKDYIRNFCNDGNLKIEIDNFYKRLYVPVNEIVSNNFFIPEAYNGNDYAKFKASSALITLKLENYFFLVASKMQNVINSKKAMDISRDVSSVRECINAIDEFMKLVDELAGENNKMKMYKASKVMNSSLKIANNLINKTGIKRLLTSLQTYLKKSVDTVDVVVSEIKLKSTLYKGISTEEKIKNQISDILFYVNGISELYYEVSKEEEFVDSIKQKYDKMNEAYYKLLNYSKDNEHSSSNIVTSLAENYIKNSMYSVLYKGKFSGLLAGGSSFANVFKPQDNIIDNIETLRDDIVSTKEKYTEYYNFIKYTYTEIKNNIKILKSTGLL